jgi:hypothetical protein
MATESYNLFCNQLNSVIKKFPNLMITELDGVKALKGILDIKNDQNEVVGSFSVEIRYRMEFPYRFPILYEVGGDIPNIADRHKYTDDSCCITVLPDEILKCKNGISVLTFIEEYAIPYFANQVYYLQNEKYLNGEYSHGKDGYIEFYTKFFKTADVSKWREDVERVKSGSTIKMNRNKLCFCGSGLKYKNCHDKIYYDISRLGTSELLNQIDTILSKV